MGISLKDLLMNSYYDLLQQTDYNVNMSEYQMGKNKEHLNEQFILADEDGKQWINGYNMKYMGQAPVKIPKPFGKFNGSAEDIWVQTVFL